MSDAGHEFVPKDFFRTGPSPTVGLGIPLYVIHGAFTHPITGAPADLPPHHWVLLEAETHRVVSTSQASDPKGICVVNAVADRGGEDAFVLGFVPAPADVRQYYVENGEAWVDLDAGSWASPQPDRTKIEARNLYRLPAWTTRRKGMRGGGFKEWPDKASAKSKDSGVLTRADIFGKAYGSLGKPWEILIDFNWVYATVKYFFVDWGRDKEVPLPPGLIVDAVPQRLGKSVERLGGGMAIKNDDGSARMLIESDASRWSGIQFLFRAPHGTNVDLSAAEPAGGARDTRLVVTAPIPKDHNVRNLLPELWHSHGQHCTAVAAGKEYGKRWGKWDDVAAQLLSDKVTDVSVEFHLDDVQLCNNDGSPRASDDGRPALFDHLMRILDAVADRPLQSDTTLDKSFLISDKAFRIGQGAPASGQRGIELTTRLVHIEGQLFDLRDNRVIGELGRTPMIGARAAVLEQHPLARYESGNPFLEGHGRYEIHLIDVPGVKDPVSGLGLKHLLLFVPCFVDEGAFPPNLLADFYRVVLPGAANRWSQGSPGVSIPTKDYRILVKDTTKRTAVIRPRGYFGQVTTGKSLEKIKLTLGPPTARANTSTTGDDPRIEFFDAAVTADVTGNQGSGNDSDNVNMAWHTLAHEFGHVFGLPDEYGEGLDPAHVLSVAANPPPVPSGVRILTYPQPFEVATDFRPFWADVHALMNHNQLPRLRHYWHSVEALNKDPAFQSAKGPFVIRHETLDLEYTHALDEHQHPYAAVFYGEQIPGGLGDCALFPIGQDEGTAQAMFALHSGPMTTLALTDRFDGILVVRSRIRFNFASTVLAIQRWALIWKDFVGKIYDKDGRQFIRFALAGGQKLARIAVLFQPHCVDSGSPDPADHVGLVITSGSPVADPFASGAVSNSTSLDVNQFNVFAMLRGILGVSTSVGTPPIANTTPLTPADLSGLAKFVDGKLGDPPGTRSVISY